MTVIPFQRPRSPEFQGYDFNVQVWFEDDVWNWSVTQEFEKVSGDEFEPLSYGEADTPAEAFAAAGEEVKAFFANV